MTSPGEANGPCARGIATLMGHWVATMGAGATAPAPLSRDVDLERSHHMTALELMRSDEPFAVSCLDMPNELQGRAQELCWRLNGLRPDDAEGRSAVLSELFGTWAPGAVVKPTFRCDYGFNIHFRGFALVNYGCTFLDTSPIRIGAGAFLAPGCVLACAGHAVEPSQRAEGIQTSAPITIGDNVWLGANVTVCGGVSIGEGSVIGAGSVVTRDVPAGVLAVGVPCRPVRELGPADRVTPVVPDRG